VVINLSSFILAIIGAGGGGAVVASAVIRSFGEKWLEGRFASRLEELRHQQATEMERLRFKVAGLLDRATKLNQREFEVLPEAWGKIDTAFVHALTALAVYRTYPELGSMSEEHCEEFLSGSKLAKYKIGEILKLKPADRSTAYVEAMGWIELNEAIAAHHEAYQTLRHHGLFINPETYGKLDEFLNVVYDALHAFQLEKRIGSAANGERPQISKFNRDGATLHSELLDYLRARFWAESGPQVDFQ